MPSDLLSVSEAARILGLSADGVRSLEKRGLLKCQKTEDGRRIFQRADVVALANERANRRK